MVSAGAERIDLSGHMDPSPSRLDSDVASEAASSTNVSCAAESPDRSYQFNSSPNPNRDVEIQVQFCLLCSVNCLVDEKMLKKKERQSLILCVVSCYSVQIFFEFVFFIFIFYFFLVSTDIQECENINNNTRWLDLYFLALFVMSKIWFGCV